MANLTTGLVQLKWLRLFEPRATMSGELKYSATLLFPKAATDRCPDAVENITALKKFLVECSNEKFGVGMRGITMPLKDGDFTGPDGGEAKYPGFYYLNTNAGENYQPVILNGSNTAVGPGDGWSHGDWGKAVISAYSYTYQAKKGVSCGLRGIQFLYKGTEDDDDYSVRFEKVVGADFPARNDVASTSNQGWGCSTPDDAYDPFDDDCDPFFGQA